MYQVTFIRSTTILGHVIRTFHVSQNMKKLNTVEPRFNEVPRDLGNLFVISRIRYIENLDLKQPKYSLYRGTVNN